MNSHFNKIYGFIKELEIIDTHEHLPPKEEQRDWNADVISEYFAQYIKDDLISSGMSTETHAKILDVNLPIIERWDLLEPYWNNCKDTGYATVVKIAARDLHGVNDISKNTIEQLNHSFKKALKPGNFKKILKEKSKIKISLLDNHLDCDKSLFRNMVRFDHFVMPDSRETIRIIENSTDIKIHTFNDWLEACEISLNKAFENGVTGLKSALAYHRTLNYQRVTKTDAEKDFFDIFKSELYPDWSFCPVIVNKKFQDYMMHFILHHVNKLGVTYQFHTGLQAGNGNMINNSDPTLLSNLFLAYPEVKFDLFHIGYPFYQKIAALAKMFPNVYIDMCWAHIISPTASINALIEWLDSVPANKISAFGGDYGMVDMVYGHQYIARKNVAKALSIKVENENFDVDRAKEIAEMLFVKNPMNLFNLEK
ncbi:amidohydrolase family protein [bacterium]|nr:amidohydrolase family protein [bacterium]